MSHVDTYRAIFIRHDIYRLYQNILKIHIQPLLQSPNVTHLCSFVQIDTLLNVTHVRGLTGREWACIDWGGRQSSGQPATLFCSTATHTHTPHTHDRRVQQVRCQHITALPFFSVLLREKRSDILWSTLQKSAACNGGWTVTAFPPVTAASIPAAFKDRIWAHLHNLINFAK